MAITGVANNTSSSPIIGGAGQANDSYSRNIQQQIARKQKELQELSSNGELTMEEKMKKRQEIQQQISDLNHQLRQHQVEKRKEQQQEKRSSVENMPGGTKKAGTAKTGRQGAGISQATTRAMISAGSSMKQAQVQGSVASGMEGRAGVLKSEIKLDAARGNSVEAKQEELAKTEQKAANAAASQLNILGEANRRMREAREADLTAERTERAKEEKTDQKKQMETAAGKTENGKAETAGGRTETADGRAETADGRAETADGRTEGTAGLAKETGSRLDIRL